jgi:hypothetical protein
MGQFDRLALILKHLYTQLLREANVSSSITTAVVKKSSPRVVVVPSLSLRFFLDPSQASHHSPSSSVAECGGSGREKRIDTPQSPHAMNSSSSSLPSPSPPSSTYPNNNELAESKVKSSSKEKTPNKYDFLDDPYDKLTFDTLDTTEVEGVKTAASDSESSTDNDNDNDDNSSKSTISHDSDDNSDDDSKLRPPPRKSHHTIKQQQRHSTPKTNFIANGLDNDLKEQERVFADDVFSAKEATHLSDLLYDVSTSPPLLSSFDLSIASNLIEISSPLRLCVCRYNILYI